MSISKSFNKRTGVYYAYETSYEWDDVKQKKVQKRKCIGRYNSETNEIEPNGKVGRPSKEAHKLVNRVTLSAEHQHHQSKNGPDYTGISMELLALKDKFRNFESTLANIHSLLDSAQALRLEIDRISNLIK